MMQTASSYWNDFPSKIFGCCADSREENHEIQDIDHPNFSYNQSLSHGNNNLGLSAPVLYIFNLSQIKKNKIE